VSRTEGLGPGRPGAQDSAAVQKLTARMRVGHVTHFLFLPNLNDRESALWRTICTRTDKVIDREAVRLLRRTSPLVALP
jgi:hypothetical protein